MKVLIADTVHENLPNGLGKLGFELKLAHDVPYEDILNIISQYEGLIIRSRFPVDEKLLKKALQLKFIGRVGAGMENIDLQLADAMGIQVVNAPEGNRDAVGEHAVGMLLMLLNNLRQANEEVRDGLWQREENRGFELSGKTVGIIGYGRMGSAFAAKLRGFDVKVLIYDVKKMNTDEDYIEQVPLQRIFEEAEVISFHVPQNESTVYYFDDDFLDRMQNNFYLINTSRGKVVKTSSVVKGIKEGKISGACLDVLEYEKTSFENLFTDEMPSDFQYLIDSYKVILSPHIAGWTFESNRKMADVLVDKIAKLKLL